MTDPNITSDTIPCPPPVHDCETCGNAGRITYAGWDHGPKFRPARDDEGGTACPDCTGCETCGARLPIHEVMDHRCVCTGCGAPATRELTPVPGTDEAECTDCWARRKRMRVMCEVIAHALAMGPVPVWLAAARREVA